MFTDEVRPSAGVIPAEPLVQNATSSDNVAAGGTLNQQVIGVL